jgi:hypothetical protein
MNDSLRRLLEIPASRVGEINARNYRALAEFQ